jgi:hypothetical protein
MRWWAVTTILALEVRGAPPPAGLARIVARNQHAAVPQGGGPPVDSLEIHLAMQERGSSLEAVYKVTRDGRMRIDILDRGRRVYTEAFDGRRGWDLGEDGHKPQADAHGTTLWHGTQFPGQIFTLQDMAGLGHKLEYTGRERVDGVDYRVVKLTLSDGFATYRYLNPKTWLIDRGRDYRAFHPAMDPHAKWIETRWSDYRRVQGKLYAFSSTNVDVSTGAVLAVQNVTALLVNPRFDPGVFAFPE